MTNFFRRRDGSAKLPRVPLRERPGPFGFLAELWVVVSRSDFFFLAGAITFNVLIAGVPLLLLVAGVSGFILTARFGSASPELLNVVLSYFPAVEGDIELTQAVRNLLSGLIEERAGFTVLATLFLLWISTRLVSTLRVVLRQVFHVEKDRGILIGKVFDFGVVFIGGFFLVLNVGVTVALRALGEVGTELGLENRVADVLQTTAGHAISFSSAWVLFFLLYRYVPARLIPFRTAAIGATFATVVYEVMKWAFAWYATSVADYSSAYGSLAVVAILFLWIYYSSAVFILGGQVARVSERRRDRQMEARQESGDGARRSGPGVATALLVVLPITLTALVFPSDGLAQDGFAPFGGNGKTTGFLNGGEGVVLAEQTLERNLSLDTPLVQTDGPYIVVHIAENRVLVMEGTEVVWSARAGTGTGYQLEGQGHEWTFTTPVGLFHVLRKEKDPVWVAPDWWYVENGQAIPASSSDRVRSTNTLGTSALFLGDGIAIHGTDRPQLLVDFIDPDDRRVSHGCIRLTNEAARELYHRVEVGTPVLIF